MEGEGSRWVVDSGDGDSDGGGGGVRRDASNSLFNQQQPQFIGSTAVAARREQQPGNTK